MPFKPDYRSLPYYMPRYPRLPADTTSTPQEPFQRLVPYITYIRRPDTGLIEILESRRQTTYLRELDEEDR